jgi:hypothetical protein
LRFSVGTGTKRLLEEQQEQRSTAIGIALAARVLRRCEYHEDIIVNTGLLDVSYAYRVGNAMLKAGELGDTFASSREMTDAVKAAIDEHVLDYCPRCDNMLAD